MEFEFICVIFRFVVCDVSVCVWSDFSPTPLSLIDFPPSQVDSISTAIGLHMVGQPAADPISGISVPATKSSDEDKRLVSKTPPYSHATVQPYRRASRPPYYITTMPPYYRSLIAILILQYRFPNLTVQSSTIKIFACSRR